MRHLSTIDDELIREGIREGSPEYEPARRAHQVARCKDARGVADCREGCAYFDYCELAKAYLYDRKFAPKPDLPSHTAVTTGSLPDALFHIPQGTDDDP